MFNKFRFGIITLLLIVIISSCNLGISAPEQDTESAIEEALTMAFAELELEAAQTRVAELEAITETPEPIIEMTATEEPAPEEEKPTETVPPEPTATIEHFTQPGEPPAGRESGVTDADSSIYAIQKRAGAGEDFSHDLYERPFSSESMDYYPDLDIIFTTLNRSGGWVYVELKMQGENVAGGLKGTYGLQIDNDIDGRGDYLILASNLQTAWSTDGVSAWKDTNNDVGGTAIILSDAPYGGNGYNQNLFDNGIGADPDLAWARIDPTDSKVAQIAFKYSLIQNDDEFLWWGHTDNLVKNPEWYDYNDHFTHEEAGSPLSSLDQYPLKALAEIDNTCRWSVGFVPDGTEPGLCRILQDPTPEPDQPTPTAETGDQTGGISGIVWVENNGNRTYDGSPDTPFTGVNVTVSEGACASFNIFYDSMNTNGEGNYYFIFVPVATYCVRIPNLGCQYQTPEQTVTVIAGGNADVDFYCIPIG